MDVNELTYGVEFECTLPLGTVVVGSYVQGAQVPALPRGWVAKSDCSIRCGRSRQGVEIVSPVLQGAEGVRQIQAVCEWLASVGACVNQSTGFHVHVGWTGDDAALGRLVTLTANHEQALYAATGTRSREQGRYCRPIQSSPEYQARFVERRETYHPDRYHLLNITNLRCGSKRTVEFRCFSGTTNATKALGYLRLCLGLVEKAHSTKRATKWVAKAPVETSPIYRKGGAGQTALTRLFYFLGWIKGRESHTYGEVGDILSIPAHKKELMRLAKKYDAAAQS